MWHGLVANERRPITRVDERFDRVGELPSAILRALGCEVIAHREASGGPRKLVHIPRAADLGHQKFHEVLVCTTEPEVERDALEDQPAPVVPLLAGPQRRERPKF